MISTKTLTNNPDRRSDCMESSRQHMEYILKFLKWNGIKLVYQDNDQTSNKETKRKGTFDSIDSSASDHHVDELSFFQDVDFPRDKTLHNHQCRYIH